MRLGIAGLKGATLAGLLVAGWGLAGCAATTRPDGGIGHLPVGSQAPSLTGVDQNGTEQRLPDGQSRPTVVYFYPMDGTPGCTTEACAFRDVWKRYEQAKVRLLGVSTDDRESHQKFALEHKLPFPLIADGEHVWGTAFGVSRGLGMYERVSFLIGSDGKVAKIYPDVDPGLHATEVLDDVKKLPPQP
jgi:peroxiredoxin Q/BCP